MIRLTKTYKDGTHGASDNLPCGENSYNYKNLLIEKLGEYEDLEEKERLIKLPCKAGDTVYHVVQGRIVEISNVDLFFLSLSVAENRFNNSVFLTKAEAEAKLKELRGIENE
uniref:Uncharacterized protein n=1 Tax=virus sp. ctQmo6 TaxID=2827990 RepID=A0A8S5RG62_9VIRU|nr:MAG TPA: hypothetical protein [virus sp. ctQmo6]